MSSGSRENVPARRVLLVDDDPSILFVLERILASQGWDTLTASSGTEALGVADQADVLVTDMCMPGLNGVELIRALRRRGNTIPAILLTADLSHTVESQARAAGAEHCMEKPFRMDELLACVDAAAMSRRDAEAAGARSTSPRAALVAA